MPKSRVDVVSSFEELFSEAHLLEAFNTRHSDAMSRGLDRRNGPAFALVAESEITIISRKCLEGSYRFTPYLESLKVKDRASSPRLISIPSIRDRIVLTQLNKLLRAVFPEASKTYFASEFVRDIAEHLRGVPVASTWTAGTDIRKFYDSINRERLQKLVARGLRHPPAATLVTRAIATPTVPGTYRRSNVTKFRLSSGVPQGLAISNALAALYLHEVDTAMGKMPVRYFRFVDDVLA